MDEVRFGVIGLGFFGEKHVETLSGIPGARVEAVCTRRDGRRREIAERFGVPRDYKDYNDLLADEKIDAVCVVTHVKDHPAPTIAALRAGKHVFLEKPMAASAMECDEIINAAEIAGGFLMVGHICRFDPRYAMARKRIDAGDIGKIVSIYARRNIPRNVSAGVLNNVSAISGDGIHDTDLVFWLTGSKVKTVYAQDLNVRGLPFAEIGWITYRLESGAIAVLESNWFLPENTPYELDARMEIIGTEGAIYIDGSDRSLYINTPEGIKNHDVTYWPEVHGVRTGALRDELLYFADCIRNERKPEVITPEESREAVAVVEAAEKSAKSGEVIRL